jgi:biofilm PGA synthesis N-glycosyltransferase PgaC
MRGYAILTPARDEARNLRRLARCLAGQSVPPLAWVIVDDGSTDGTAELARELAARHAWVRALGVGDGVGDLVAGREAGRDVRAFHAGLAAVPDEADVVLKVDADVSLGRTYFERLLAVFDEDPALGIASGTCLERSGGGWRPRHTTGTSVWGAARAYRRACLDAVLPLEERMGWDGIDELKAQAHGWRTRTLPELTFRHNRPEGARDASPWAAWSLRGRASHYMGYRPTYLALRSLGRARREPAALGLLAGYARAALRREPRCEDLDVRARLRRPQRWRHLRARSREAAGAESLDVLLVCSGGGHLLQLWSLRAAWEDLHREWVVASFEQSDVSSLLGAETVVFAYEPTVRNVKNLVRNVLLARRVLRRVRPRAIVTTGSAVAVPFAWVGRLYGVRTVYVESLARTTAPSLSCRLAAPVADRVYVQWPELQAALPAARYAGTVYAPE